MTPSNNNYYCYPNYVIIPLYISYIFIHTVQLQGFMACFMTQSCCLFPGLKLSKALPIQTQTITKIDTIWLDRDFEIQASLLLLVRM